MSQPQTLAALAQSIIASGICPRPVVVPDARPGLASRISVVDGGKWEKSPVISLFCRFRGPRRAGDGTGSAREMRQEHGLRQYRTSVGGRLRQGASSRPAILSSVPHSQPSRREGEPRPFGISTLNVNPSCSQPGRPTRTKSTRCGKGRHRSRD